MIRIFSRNQWRSLFAILLISMPASDLFAAAKATATVKTTATAKSIANPVPASQNVSEKPRAEIPFNRTLSFKQLGLFESVRLRGNVATASVPFSMRLDELATRARLNLRFTASPALLADLSHVRVYLNEELINTVVLNKEQLAVMQLRTIDFDPRLISDYNQLRFELVGHYSRECEDPAHTSIWLDIDNGSELQLTTERLTLADDLSLLPAPFFDRRDNRAVNLPFVFAKQPSQKILQAAGVAASWFGALADYRGARFPYTVGALPAAHSLLFVVNGEKIDGIDLTPVNAATISLRARKDDPSIKLLVVQGRNEDDLMLAVNALVLGQAVFTGSSASVSSVDLGELRKPYDAPRWVRTDRPVHLGELIDNPLQLQVRGYTPGPMRVNVRLPADLMTNYTRGAAINLKYRYTPPLERDNSTLNININDQYVQTFRLQPSGEIGQRDRVVLPLIDTQTWSASTQITIPAFQVGSNNQLQFNFMFDQSRGGACRSVLGDNMQAAIDPDSTIDFSGFPHYIAMPNLAAFANSGYPFTKLADLSQTAVVLPDAAQAGDIEAMLELMGWMGRWSGFPALRYQLTTVSQLPKNADLDLLLIGSALQQSDKLNWEKNLPVLIDKNRRKFQPADLAASTAFIGVDPHRQTATPNGAVTVESGGDLGAFVSFESPIQSDRTVVAITGSTQRALRNSLDALADGGRVRDIRGDLALVHAANINSYQVATNYYVGNLSWWRVIWFHLSMHPVLLALFGIIVSVIGAVFLYNALRRYAERRLRGQG